VRLSVTTSRANYERIVAAGQDTVLKAFGAQVIQDACWCTVMEPIVPSEAKVIMTNSGKYAHYGPGLSGKIVRFGSLADCVEAACTGCAINELPAWLR
jgi:predicted aconitase